MKLYWRALAKIHHWAYSLSWAIYRYRKRYGKLGRKANSAYAPYDVDENEFGDQ